MANTYDYCAKGVILRDEHVNLPVDAFRGIDFAINYVGWGAVSDYSVNSPKRLDMPYALGIPVIAMVKMDVGPYTGSGWGGPLPAPDVDPHMKLLDRALYFNATYGGQMRYYHGLLWDITYMTDANGVTFTPVWQAGMAEHLAANHGWKRYKLPWWIFGSQAMFTVYEQQKQDTTPLQVLFDKWNSSAAKYAWNPGAVVLPDLKTFPLPPQVKDSDGNWVDQKPHYLHAKRWEFWQTSNEKFKVTGVTDGDGVERYVPTVLYNGSREQLYRVLGFTAPGQPPVEPPPSGDPDDDDNGNGDGDGGGGSMDPEMVARMVAALESMAGSLDAFTKGWKK